MYLVTEFRRYARECRHMAAICPNKQDKDHWNQLGERWLRCADNLQRENEATTERTTRRIHRKISRLMGRSRQAA